MNARTICEIELQHTYGCGSVYDPHREMTGVLCELKTSERSKVMSQSYPRSGSIVCTPGLSEKLKINK